MRLRVAIVGGGITGLAHALLFRKIGAEVSLFERDKELNGASPYAYGNLWPIGVAWQEKADAHRSLRTWLQIISMARAWCQHSGSLHIARDDGEKALLSEYFKHDGNSDLSLLNARQIKSISPSVNIPSHTMGLHSRTERLFSPRHMLGSLQRLAREQGVKTHAGESVLEIQPRVLVTRQRRQGFDCCVVCTGGWPSNILGLPENRTPLLDCKLQMLALEPQRSDMEIGPTLSAGATLFHSPSFRELPSFYIAHRIFKEKYPYLIRFGIHTNIAKTKGGNILVGDSHQYSETRKWESHEEIDMLMLQYARGYSRAVTGRVAGRWVGHYVKTPDKTCYRRRLGDSIIAVVGCGGTGFTMAFSHAAKTVREFFSNQ
jgi:D-hydroxyproline dehydrogenase subunit beta